MINTLKSMREEINEMDCELSCKKQAINKVIIKLKKELEEMEKGKQKFVQKGCVNIKELIGEQ